MKPVDRMMQLFDALFAAPEGLDIYQIGEVLHLDVSEPGGTGRAMAFSVIRDLRIRLGNLNDQEDSRAHGYTVPIRHEGTRQIYFLTANKDQATDWQSIRFRTVLSRLDVDLAHWQSLVASTDAATTPGRIARAYVRHFTRLIEDVRAIADEGF